MNLTAQQLNGTHIGKTITAPTGDTSTIASIKHTTAHTEVRLDPSTEDGTHTLLLRRDTHITITGQKGGRIGQSGNTGTFAREPFQETARQTIKDTLDRIRQDGPKT